MIAQRLDVNHAAHVGRSGTVFLPSHDLSLVVDDKGTTAECVDGGIFFGEEIIGAHIGGHEIHIVIEGTSAALNLEDLVCRLLLEKKNKTPTLDRGCVNGTYTV